MKLKDLNNKQLKVLIERLVPFESLTDVRYGNILCPFHPNKNTPSAKFYNDEDGIVRLHCFSEHRMFTSYDYLKLKMKVDPVKYLKGLYSNKDIDSFIKLAEDSNSFDVYHDDEKIDEIHNTWVDSLEDISSFLDSIYVGYNIRDYR